METINCDISLRSIDVDADELIGSSGAVVTVTFFIGAVRARPITFDVHHLRNVRPIVASLLWTCDEIQSRFGCGHVAARGPRVVWR